MGFLPVALPHGFSLAGEWRGVMSFKDAVAKAKASRPEPVLVEIAVGDALFSIETTRLKGMDWASITAECVPSDAKGYRLGYDTNKAALLACKRHSRLLDADGEVVEDVDWDDLFDELSGVEVGALAAVWWVQNMNDPNEHVAALKKASAGGVKTSSS